MKSVYLLAFLLLPSIFFGQSTFQTALKAGEIVVAGLSFLKASKAEPIRDTKVIESVCVKNRMTDKITFTINGESNDGDKVKKELVIQADGKECFLELPKGSYTYEVILANKEVFKKGDYKFDDDVVITIKKDD